MLDVNADTRQDDLGELPVFFNLRRSDGHRAVDKNHARNRVTAELLHIRRDILRTLRPPHQYRTSNTEGREKIV